MNNTKKQPQQVHELLRGIPPESISRLTSEEKILFEKELHQILRTVLSFQEKIEQAK